MKAKRFAVFLAFLTFSVWADDPVSQRDIPLSERAHEIETAINNYSIVSRPKDKSLNEILQCRAQDLFDPRRVLLTEGDFAELSKLKCHDRFCVGDKAPFDATLKLIIERNNEQIEWIKAQKETPLNVRGKESIPSTLTWSKYAANAEERQTRWKKLLTFYVIDKMIQMNPEHPESVDVKEAQKIVIDEAIEGLEAQNERWKNKTEAEKEEDLIHARMTCLDNHSRLFTRKRVEANSGNDGTTDYPVTWGLRIFTDPKAGVFVGDVLPGSPASLSKKFLPLDKIKTVKYRGKEFDFTKLEEAQAFFQLQPPPKEHEKLDFTLERDGSSVEASIEMARTIPYDALVFSQDRKISGKRFRVVSVPSFIGDDEKLSPKEKISTSAQVEYALSDTANYDAVVLDLRSNKGGIALEGSKLAGAFLSKNPNPTSVVASKLLEDGYTVNVAGSGNPYSDKPLFILTDRQTASASEIAVSALVAAKRAVVIGEPTFGKGIEQTGQKLADGSMFYQTTNLNVGLGDGPFHEKGLEPHLSVPYLSGLTNPKEKQPVEMPPIKGELPKLTYTGDYYRVNEKALTQTQEWAKGASKGVPVLKEYYGVMSELKGVYDKATLPLNLEKARGREEKIHTLQTQAAKLGGADNSHEYFNFGIATDWSLMMAARYMEFESESSAQTKAEAKP